MLFEHVEVDGLSAMNVKLAAQVLCRSVASILCYLTASGMLPGSNTADFCALMDDLFDSVNGRMLKHHSKPLLSAVSKTSPHLKSWETFTDFLESVEFLTDGRKTKFPCLNGWLITLSAFRQLIPELLTNIPYILMSRFTQDCLENFFSCVRRKGGNNDHPTPFDFKCRIRMLMAEHVINSCNTNCEPDDDDVLVPLEFLMNPEMEESEANSDIVDNADITDDAAFAENADISNNINIQNCNIISDGNINIDSNTNIVNNDSVDCVDSESNIHDVFEDDTEIFNDEMHEADAAFLVGGYVAHVTLKKFQCIDCQA